MSQKTSSRTNTQQHKGHSRKNGGSNVKHIFNPPPQLTTYCKYFYKGANTPPIPKPKEFIEHYAYETIKKHLGEGKTIEEIKKIFIDSLEKQKYQMSMMKLLNCSIKEYVGIEDRDFYINWCNAVGVCLKLKAIPNDDQNGVLEFAMDENKFKKFCC